MYSERDSGCDSDNLINYNAGPVSISISGWSEEIIISTNDMWDFLLPQFLEIAEEAWCLNELPKHDIKINKSKRNNKVINFSSLN